MATISMMGAYVTALEGLVNMNALAAMALFVGLSFTVGQHSLERRGVCDAGPDVANKFLLFEFISFSFLFFSGSVAHALKVAIKLSTTKKFPSEIRIKGLKFWMFASAMGSVLGCVSLTLSLLHVIQMRLGMFWCGNQLAELAATLLVIFTSTGLIVHIWVFIYAFIH